MIVAVAAGVGVGVATIGGVFVCWHKNEQDDKTHQIASNQDKTQSLGMAVQEIYEIWCRDLVIREYEGRVDRMKKKWMTLYARILAWKIKFECSRRGKWAKTLWISCSGSASMLSRDIKHWSEERRPLVDATCRSRMRYVGMGRLNAEANTNCIGCKESSANCTIMSFCANRDFA